MIHYDTFTLDNGLRVVHSHDPQTAMVVVDLLYDTGSRDESPELTGMAHLFEHLMFGGSVNVPEFDRLLEKAGGSNNAATSNDFTYFYDLVPAQNAEMAFYLESDRMLSLAFNPHSLEVQRNVVIEEFKQTTLNRPYGRSAHHLLPMLFGSHPYSWPVIGCEPAHIERVAMENVKEWFYTHYAPNNAILAVVGRISLEETKRLTQKWFGDIPRRPVKERRLEDTPWLLQPVRKVVTDVVPQTALTMAWRMDAYGEPGYLEADAITDILSAGTSSRFYRRLVRGNDLITAADASISGLEHQGMLMASVRLDRGDDTAVDEAIAIVENEVRQLAEPGNVTEYELQRTKNRHESTSTFENMNLINLAQNLARAIYHGEDINEQEAAYRSLTCEGIAATARRLFIDHAPAILITRPV